MTKLNKFKEVLKVIRLADGYTINKYEVCDLFYSIVEILGEMELDIGTGKKIQEQDHAQAQRAAGKLVGVDSTDDNKGNTGHLRISKWVLRSFGVKSKDGETEQAPGTET